MSVEECGSGAHVDLHNRLAASCHAPPPIEALRLRQNRTYSFGQTALAVLLFRRSGDILRPSRSVMAGYLTKSRYMAGLQCSGGSGCWSISRFLMTSRHLDLRSTSGMGLAARHICCFRAARAASPSTLTGSSKAQPCCCRCCSFGLDAGLCVVRSRSALAHCARRRRRKSKRSQDNRMQSRLTQSTLRSRKAHDKRTRTGAIWMR